MKVTFLLFGLIAIGFTQVIREPAREVCEPTVLRPSSRWESEFPTNAAFTGFFEVTGTIYAAVGDTLIPVFNLVGGLFHGYVDPVTELFMNDMYLDFGFGLQHTVRASINAIPGTSLVCQRFMEPSPEFNRGSYSEISYPGVGFGFTRYFTPGAERRVTGTEYYDFDDTKTSAIIGVDSWTRGSGTVGHSLFQHSQLTIVRVTYERAVALGYTGNNTAFPSRRGLHIGNSMLLPIEALTQRARDQLRV